MPWDTKNGVFCQRYLIAIALLATAICGGCKSAWELKKSPLQDRSWMSSYKKPNEEKIEYRQPERIAVIWSDSVASADDNPNVRGFGGRFYFYDKDGNPVRVNGELTVYAFDDTVENRKAQADRVYKFRQSELQSHFGETSLGPSYSFWIPWDKVGGDRKTIALMPVFKTAENQVVKSGQSINVLPGKTPVQVASKANEVYRVLGSSPTVPRTASAGVDVSKYGVQLASATESVARNSLSPTDRTTTISVPRPMTKRLTQDLAAANLIRELSDGSSGNVSYGPRAKPTAEAPSSLAGPLGKSISSIESPTETDAKGAADAAEPTPRSRPVFGAPGARK